MEALKAGDVVYLRGDEGWEQPLTVKGVYPNVDTAICVVWLTRDRNVATWFGPRECFMTMAESYADKMRREEERRQARDSAVAHIISTRDRK